MGKAFLTRLTALLLKELLALWKDKRSRLVLIVPPLLQGLLFGYAASFDLHHVALAVYDQDGSAPARELIAHFTGTPAFTQVARLTHEEQIADYINGREAALVLRLGPNFSRDLLTANGAKLQAIVDGRDSNTALIILNYVNAIVYDFNRQWLKSHDLPEPPARLTVRAWFNPNLESRWFILPGLVGMITMVISLIITSLSIAREREEGTFDQLLVTPLRPLEILLGKTLPAAFIGLLEASFILLLAVFWFDVPMLGSLWLLYLGIGLFLLSTVGVGLMISSLARTQQQAFLGAFLFLVPSVILSGFATPIDNMPQAIQYLTYVNPLRYFLEISRGVFLQQLSFQHLFHLFWPMAIIGLITMTTAALLFRRRLQ
jgi:ABC-2 type transport system permease protein